MEMRVSVEDATSASELVQRLARLFDLSSISFDRGLNEVRVQSEWESRAVAGVIEVVMGWLEEDGAESATLSIGGSSDTLVSVLNCGSSRDRCRIGSPSQAARVGTVCVSRSRGQNEHHVAQLKSHEPA